MYFFLSIVMFTGIFIYLQRKKNLLRSHVDVALVPFLLSECKRSLSSFCFSSSLNYDNTCRSTSCYLARRTVGAGLYIVKSD